MGFQVLHSKGTQAYGSHGVMTTGWSARILHFFSKLLEFQELVAGLEHEWIVFPYIGNDIIPIDFYIFQRDWNHQPESRFFSFRNSSDFFN